MYVFSLFFQGFSKHFVKTPDILDKLIWLFLGSKIHLFSFNSYNLSVSVYSNLGHF